MRPPSPSFQTVSMRYPHKGGGGAPSSGRGKGSRPISAPAGGPSPPPTPYPSPWPKAWLGDVCRGPSPCCRRQQPPHPGLLLRPQPIAHRDLGKNPYSPTLAAIPDSDFPAWCGVGIFCPRFSLSGDLFLGLVES